MPVVDRENRLVGIVTVDDVMDVMEEEATEDSRRWPPSSPPAPLHRRLYLAEKPHRLAARAHGFGHDHRRHPGRYGAAFAAMPLLVTFIPMLTDTGATRAVSRARWSSAVWPSVSGPPTSSGAVEGLRVSLAVGAALSAVNARLLITHPGSPALALTVALALFATVVMAKTIGGVLPMAARMLKADPAIMAAPLITTIVDAFALVIYFSVAQALLGL
ncbi:MAG: magnesium transporter [Anaerotruncus massiliensis (ex Togo et al. 2019)]